MRHLTKAELAALDATALSTEDVVALLGETTTVADHDPEVWNGPAYDFANG